MTEYTSTISDTISSDNISDTDEVSDSIDTNTCCICLEEVPDESSYKLEQCGHLFHTNCIVRNIQQGNISCPCCRKLPLFISNVNHSYDLREDLIDEYNEDQRNRLFLKAKRIVASGSSSRSLIKLVTSYKKIYDKINKLKESNEKINKILSERNKVFKFLEHEEMEEYRNIRKKYIQKRRDVTKSFKIPKKKEINYDKLNGAFEKIINYMGYRAVEY